MVEENKNQDEEEVSKKLKDVAKWKVIASENTHIYDNKDN